MDGNTASSFFYFLGLAVLLFLHAFSLVNLALPATSVLSSIKDTDATPRKSDFEAKTNRIDGNLTDSHTPMAPQKPGKPQKKGKKGLEVKEEAESQALRKSFEIEDVQPEFSPSSANRPAKKEPVTNNPPFQETAEEAKAAKPHRKHHKKGARKHAPK